MPYSDQMTRQLHERGFRMTPQRAAILNILEQENGHLTPAQVFERASHSMPGITEPTVYRTLEFLAQNNLALAAHVGSGKLVYEIGKDHHHLICRVCGHSVEIPHVTLERAYHELEGSTGFKLNTSHNTFFGLCPDCQTGQ